MSVCLFWTFSVFNLKSAGFLSNSVCYLHFGVISSNFLGLLPQWPGISPWGKAEGPSLCVCGGRWREGARVTQDPDSSPLCLMQMLLCRRPNPSRWFHATLIAPCLSPGSLLQDWVQVWAAGRLLLARARSKARVLTWHSSARLLCPPAIPHSRCLQASCQRAHPGSLWVPSSSYSTREQDGFKTHMFIAVLFPVAKRWKQPTCLSMDAWIHKIWYMHTMKYYPASKRRFQLIL